MAEISPSKINKTEMMSKVEHADDHIASEKDDSVEEVHAKQTEELTKEVEMTKISSVHAEGPKDALSP